MGNNKCKKIESVLKIKYCENEVKFQKYLRNIKSLQKYSLKDNISIEKLEKLNNLYCCKYNYNFSIYCFPKVNNIHGYIYDEKSGKIELVVYDETIYGVYVKLSIALCYLSKLRRKRC